jgi:hypothetical protein
MKFFSGAMILLVAGFGLTAPGRADGPPSPAGKIAAKPLFRDPVYDGAADPTVIYNAADQKWYMFYTVRRANVPGLNGVGWIHGTPIGIATSSDGGADWQYAGQAKSITGMPSPTPPGGCLPSSSTTAFITCSSATCPERSATAGIILATSSI